MSLSLRRSALVAIVALLTAQPIAALAVDTPTTKDAPDLTAIRVKIKAKDYKSAAADLYSMIDKGVQHADVYNLLGFSLRKSGDKTAGATFYRKALDFDPDHLGALEYQGELFVELGEIDKAKANLAKLVKLCPTGCEEREDLEKALAAAETAAPKTN